MVLEEQKKSVFYKKILLVYLLVGFISSSSLSAQTYFKSLDIFENQLSSGFSLDVKDEMIVISTKTPCIYSDGDTLTCLGVSLHDEYGNIIWGKTFEWITSGNSRSINFLGDSIVVSGHDSAEYFFQGENNVHALILDVVGDSLNHFKLELDEFVGSNGRVFNNGNLVTDDEIYIFGSTKLPSDTIAGIIQSVEFSGLAEEPLIYKPINGEMRPMWDLTQDTDSTLVFIDFVDRISPGNKSNMRITRVTKDGEIINRFFGPERQIGPNLQANLVVLDNGNYLYIYNIELAAASSRTEELICTDKLGEIIWTYAYPSEVTSGNGPIFINEIIVAENGDIIGCGHRYVEGFGGRIQDAYLFRMNPEGDMLWEKYYNIEESDGLGRAYLMREVKEMYDGSIVAIGSKPGTGLVPILRVDAGGCLQGNCDESILVNTIDLNTFNSFDIKFYPNPVLQIGTLNFSRMFFGKIKLYNNQFQLIYTRNVDGIKDLSFDFSTLSKGMYYIQSISNNGYQKSIKIIVI